ncbi:MAG: tripartite tricarboxylate transporter substrate binding protein, partial [Alphaproteobacteria bacterium]|nr:tripartite tricarboxylate transporter substrate binding protein [Alphaproteobacteria bacterium]
MFMPPSTGMCTPFRKLAAGSTSDLIGRILAERLSSNLGQRVVVDNRGGAGGTLAAEYVARAAPDGYTLLFGTIATHGISPAI